MADVRCAYSTADMLKEVVGLTRFRLIRHTSTEGRLILRLAFVWLRINPEQV